MDYKVTYHDNTQAYASVSHEWKLTLRRHESGTWIFPPLAGVSYLIRQFAIDQTKISKELFGDESTLLAVDCTLSGVLQTKDNFEHELFVAIAQRFETLPATVLDMNALLRWLGSQRITLALFISGLDATLRAGNMEIFASLNRLAISNGFVSVLLTLCTDATDPEFWPAFSKYASLIQNLSIMPRKSNAEGKSFFRSLETEWGVLLSDEQKQWVEDNLDYELRCTKEVFRQVQKNPALTYDDLYALPSLEHKTQALLDNFLEDQREVILRTVFGTPITAEYDHALRYLKSIRWVGEENGKLKMTIPYVDYYIHHQDRKAAADRVATLTVKEEAAFGLLESRRNQVVTRDEIADAIWGDASAERYSDWAIDQLIHRLKAKVGTQHSSIAIRAVRGRGFILESR